MRIAMWSGPRNLSTAMMYSFGSRPDFAVVDEPFYAAYLDKTGLNHPMREEVLASQPKDPEEVVTGLGGPIPGAKPHYYQKHMTQHMIEGVPRNWIAKVVNVFLIRHPARVVASFNAKYDNPTLSDIGFLQQMELYDQACATGPRPVVIDSSDIRRNPEVMLKKLCEAINLDWDPAMLSWPAGGHADDGVWASHWYGSVHASTGFAAEEGPLPELTSKQKALAESAMPVYETLSSAKLKLT